jgi:hypothetical protein
VLIDRLFPFFFAFCVAWVGFWLVISAYLRRRSGKPLFPTMPIDAAFKENACSGRSLKNLLTSIGGAHGALQIYVKGGNLVITPLFPFNLLFLPEIYGLDYEVPVRRISRVERNSSLFGESLRIHFENGAPPSVEVRVRKPEELIQALARPTS